MFEGVQPEIACIVFNRLLQPTGNLLVGNHIIKFISQVTIHVVSGNITIFVEMKSTIDYGP